MDISIRNQIIVALMQALLGAISSNFRAVLIDFSQGLDVRFFLVKDSIEDADEIDDVITEFDSLLMGVEALAVKYSVEVGEGRIDFSGDNVIPIYIRRE
ncbi:hypothetical protein Q8O96_24500 [Pseudomonas sp. LPH60]|uniref:hypothetical protein n=1 Tax=Pseudomonas sp. LPH60 TaxID=3065906 RepID=UPI00273B2AE3|nr:hypothetical protein [Pseudomonas sp. LPH60]MDP4572237.1 hypothetical protein [Pseudomonas sp. LPH60]